jgi:hypothetical protein
MPKIPVFRSEITWTKRVVDSLRTQSHASRNQNLDLTISIENHSKLAVTFNNR